MRGDQIEHGGGTLLMRFPDENGLPTAFVTDPDGYVLQLSARGVRVERV